MGVLQFLEGLEIVECVLFARSVEKLPRVPKIASVGNAKWECHVLVTRVRTSRLERSEYGIV